MDTAVVRNTVIDLLKILLVFGGIMQTVPVLVYFERRICAWIQDRVGPNRVGPFGLLQPVADAVKFIFKEDIIPEQADRALFCVAPIVALVPAAAAFAVIPFGNAVTLTEGGVAAAGAAVMAGGIGAGVLLLVAAAGLSGAGPSLRWLTWPAALAAVAAGGGGALAGWGLGALARTIPPEGHLVRLQVADLETGVLFFAAVASLGVYGIAFGGWASNNKFSLLGSLRAGAQMISYEITLGLAIIIVLMTSAPDPGTLGTVRMSGIVERQAAPFPLFGLPGWNIFYQPVAFVLFLIAAFAENNRLPFDLSECEPELIGGYHTEYSSMKFALFFMGEYIAMITMSAMLVTLFLGGWHVPGLNPADTSLAAGLVSMAAFAAKTGAVLFLYIWVRWSIPRFRYDQLMKIGWKVLVPVAVANIVVTAVLGVL